MAKTKESQAPAVVDPKTLKDAAQDESIKANTAKADKAQKTADAAAKMANSAMSTANATKTELEAKATSNKKAQAKKDEDQDKAISEKASKADVEKASKDAAAKQSKKDAAQDDKISMTQRVLNSNVESIEATDKAQDEKIEANKAKAEKDLADAKADQAKKDEAQDKAAADGKTAQAAKDAEQDDAIAQNKGAASTAAKLGFEARTANAKQDEAIAANKAEIERTRKDAEENFQVSMAKDEELKAAMNAKDAELEDKINATEEARDKIDQMHSAVLDAHTKGINDTAKKQNDLRDSIAATKKDVKELEADMTTSRDTLCKQGNKINALESKAKKAYEDIEAMQQQAGKAEGAWKAAKANTLKTADHERRVTENEREIKSMQFNMKGAKDAIEENYAADVERANRQAAEDNKQNAALERVDFDNQIQAEQLDRLNRADSKNIVTDSDQDYKINKLQKQVAALEKKCSKAAIFGRVALTIALSIAGAVAVILCL